MPGTCPTVRVIDPVAPGGFVIINASEFDPVRHEKHITPPPPPPMPPPPPPPPSDALSNLAKDWRNGKTNELRSIAASLGGRTPDNREQAIQMIEQALAARGK